MRLYQAFIQLPGDAVSRRASLEARDLDDARRRFELAYPGATIWGLASEDSANRPR